MSDGENQDAGLDVSITDGDGGLVLRWVLVAEVIDEDGTESLRVRTTDGMAMWTQLGLLRFAAACIESEPC